MFIKLTEVIYNFETVGWSSGELYIDVNYLLAFGPYTAPNSSGANATVRMSDANGSAFDVVETPAEIWNLIKLEDRT